MNSVEYEQKLQEIERRNPKEPLLRTLQQGYSALNIIYMAAAVKRLPAPEAEGAPANADKTLRELWAERTRLFGEMNKLSNLFHGMKTNEQRADNSKAIMRVWDKILQAKARIAAYEANGELIEEEDEKAIPEGPVALAKRLASLRSQISQRRRRILELAEDKQANQQDIDRIEEELKRLRLAAGIIDQKLKQYGQAEE